ncbi:phospholipid scramblase 4-like isoform X2 [Nycticebus coucang]|uniref:phospholipid scramblase 4-like isoform X2 n=1 Tax=Nycticebus coucang TaxID=9470 RepID=UPI00234CC5B1|nr:phospholipid scramblase 4-like isoform X2 [Nycticebus coucang]
MSDVVPTAPEQPSDEMKNEVTLSYPRLDDPPDYNSYFVPGPPGPAVPPPAGYPGGLPMGYYGPQQPSIFPLGQPTDPILYPPGRYPMPNQPVAVMWMPGPPPVPNCPPGLEYLTQMEVQCPPGVTLGFVKQDWSLCRAVYSIQNEKKESEMRVRGPCILTDGGSDSVYEVTSPDGVSHIGRIIRQWRGVLSLTTDADHFDIQFPLDLDVKMKAMIFGACFLIDFMYYEGIPQQDSSRVSNQEVPTNGAGSDCQEVS